MNLGICTMASSSKGNCCLIKSDSTCVLLDAGFPAGKTAEDLGILGLKFRDIDAVLLTHEHTDHIRSAAAIRSRAQNAPFIATKGTADRVRAGGDRFSEDMFKTVSAGETFTIGDIHITAVETSHDASEPVTYIFSRNGKKISVVTDTGVMTPELTCAVSDSDILVIEANHEENILLYGKYPYSVKRRILSDRGHLSNEAAGYCIRDMIKTMKSPKIPYVILAHLSRENNTPQQAILTVRNILEEAGLYVGRHLRLEVADPEEMGNFVAV